MHLHRTAILLLTSIVSAKSAVDQQVTSRDAPESFSTDAIKTQFVAADGLNIFYRSAGSSNAPVVLLLHGFPTASYQYRNLMALLAPKYHVIAPDLPSFGFTVVPESRNYKYTFVNFGKTIEAFVDALHLTKFAIYIFDYGAPTGFYLALARPDSITAIISQNGNTYKEGLGPAWKPIEAYWADPSTANRDALRPFFTLSATESQYTTGVPPKLNGSLDPLGWTLDTALMARPGIIDIQLDIFYDYRNNVATYPKWQAYLRERQPPLLAVWGKNDQFFIPPGAEAFKKDVPQAKVILLDTGHFALETHLVEIAKQIEAFLG